MPGKRWTANELRALQQALDAGRAPSKIQIRGRSPHSVKRKLVREGLIDTVAPARLPWTADEVAELKRLVAEGLTARQIHRGHMPARSYDSIAQKISRLKLLAGQGRSQQLRDCRRLEGDEFEEFRTAIERFAETRHTAWFVWKFAVGRGKVKRALRAAGKEVTWGDAMRQVQTKRRFAQRVSNASARSWQKRREAMKAELVGRFHEMERELERDPALGRRAAFKHRRCETCNADWFANETFFRPSFKRLPGGKRKRYLQRRCRICTSGLRGTAAKERIREAQRRDQWRRKLDGFGEALMLTHPDLYREPEEGLAIRWEPFVQALESKTTPHLYSLVESIVRIYAEADVSDVLDALEEECFGGEPELHTDIWNLDEGLRQEPAQRPQLVREGRLLPAGRHLAIRIYRVVRLPAYASSLV